MNTVVSEPDTKVSIPKKRRDGKATNVHYLPNDKDRHLVKMCSIVGIPHRQIALMVINPATAQPIKLDTLYAHYRDELDHGPAKATAAVVGGLYYNAVIENNPSCQQFWLRTQGRRFGWPSEKEATEVLPDPEKMEFDVIDIARRFAWLIHQGKKARGLT